MFASIKIELNKNQLFLLKQEMENLLPLAPVDGWETETSVIALFYVKNIRKLSFFPTHKKTVKISFSYADVFAVNHYFSANSNAYNMFIRNTIEPKLPVCKS